MSYSGTIAGGWDFAKAAQKGAAEMLRLYGDFLFSEQGCRARGAYAFSAGAAQDAAEAHEWLKERGYLQ